MWGLKRWGTARNFSYSTQRTATSVKNLVLYNIIHYCTVNLHFPMLRTWSIEGNSVVHSWQPSTMNVPGVQFYKMFFFLNSYR